MTSKRPFTRSSIRPSGKNENSWNSTPRGERHPGQDMSARADVGFSSYQKFVAAILAFLNFTVILDFMILSPLGAQLMPALQISPVQFGLLVSTYAFSAGVSGILAAGFADRFDRKKLLLIFYAGFLAGTLLCGLASSYHALLSRAVDHGRVRGRRRIGILCDHHRCVSALRCGVA
jgi:hypothetical protein